ncbi:MAG TPA: M3 family metallopeptidase [Bacteroidales bacterium]|nr:M3 family metallopeptidase [Bacteroidales bacterium]HOS58027.1 M3 family metallopeptidase [Bacteroidales bacterium]HRR03766.1 M3 family metallopeptidase [Bacteroidales bacterium]
MAIFALSAIFLFSCGKKKDDSASQDTANPFFKTWTTPYGIPPFEEIKAEHYIPAFERGMEEQIAEIDAIVNNPEAPTFENTILALEYSGELLYNVAAVFFNLMEAVNSPEMEKIAENISPKLSKHSDNIGLNPELFKRIKTVYDNKENLNLTAEQMRLLEENYKSFVRGGANIPVEQQPRFREINEKLSLLTLKFGNNVLKATNNYKLVVDDVAQLEGMPKGQLEAALEAGKADKATEGKYVFTIHLPSMEPFLMNCKNRELRKELWTAYSTRCSSDSLDNSEIINEIVNLRLERANILGFPSHAAYVLDDCMAKTPEAVNNLLMQVWKPALAKAKKEAQEYQKMIIAEGNSFKLAPYDWRYYSEQLRKAKYDLDDDVIRPYLSLENVKEGIFTVCNKLYGISFKENNELPKYHPDVETYEVMENDQVIAILYLDFFPRESKRSGAWMTNFREQYVKDGKNVIPIVSLVCNFTKPTAEVPSLLNFDETSTFFHEFGHGLHSILSKCTYRSLSGTNVPRDFVELPSQFFEHWATEPEVMKMYAKHYATGETIPDELIDKLEKAATYGQGFINTELLAASFLDMDYYTITKPTNITLPEYENAAMKKIGLIPEIISRYKSPYFQHIFSGGYSSGYYSYTWAAVLDNDAFEPFKEKGIFDPETAKSFRTNILEKGNTEEPMTLYIKYRGQEPSIEPLLKNRGLK